MKSGRVGKHGGRRRREKSRRKRPEVLPKRKIRLVDGCTGNKAAEGLFRRGEQEADSGRRYPGRKNPEAKN